MRYMEEPYKPPPGSQDFPFTYVYNGQGQTDGQAQLLDIAQQLQGDSDFVLRRIVGVPSCVNTAALGGRFNYRNASGSYAAGNTPSGIVYPVNWPVIPEKVYPYNNIIRFDLYQLLRQVTSCGGGDKIYTSFIGFNGVKRFQAGHGYPTQKTPYQYREVTYAYEFTLTIDWGYFTAIGSGVTNPYHQFNIQMEQYDFELDMIRVCREAGDVRGGGGDGGGGGGGGGPDPGGVALTTDDFAITFYDANTHQLSDLPLPVTWWNSSRVTPARGPVTQGVLPVPPLVFPAGSQILFDVYSFLCVEDLPQTYYLSFDGVWRVPCNASR